MMEIVPILNTVVAGTASISGIALLIAIIDLLNKIKVFKKYKVKFLNSILWDLYNTHTTMSSENFEKEFEKYLEIKEEIERLSILFDEKKKTKSDLTPDEIDDILRLRGLFFISCNENLSVNERKEITEGLYKQKSELAQANYMLNLINDSLNEPHAIHLYKDYLEKNDKHKSSSE